MHGKPLCKRQSMINLKILFRDYAHKMPSNYPGIQNIGHILSEWNFVNNSFNPLINFWTWLKQTQFILTDSVHPTLSFAVMLISRANVGSSLGLFVFLRIINCPLVPEHGGSDGTDQWFLNLDLHQTPREFLKMLIPSSHSKPTESESSEPAVPTSLSNQPSSVSDAQQDLGLCLVWKPGGEVSSSCSVRY